MKSLVYWMVMGVAISLCCTASVQAADPIKLVYGEALSGNFQDVGERSAKGVEYAVKEINDSGGILGRPVKLFIFDHEMKMDVTTRKATEFLLKEKAKYYM